MTTRPEPYLRRDPGDVIRSGDWNEMQIQIREETHAHRHTGAADGLKIPRAGIEPGAVDGSLIDPTAHMTFNTLNLSGDLKVKDKSIPLEIDSLLGAINTLTNSLNDLGAQHQASLDRINQLEGRIQSIENGNRVLASVHISGGIVSGTNGVTYDAASGVVTFPNPDNLLFTPVISDYNVSHYSTTTLYVRQVTGNNQFQVWRTTLDTGDRNYPPGSFTAIVVGFTNAA